MIDTKYQISFPALDSLNWHEKNSLTAVVIKHLSKTTIGVQLAETLSILRLVYRRSMALQFSHY